MTVTLEEAHAAAKNLRSTDVLKRAEAALTVQQFLDQAMSRALQNAFDLPSAPDGPPLVSREDCPNCGGRGYTGRHTHDPQLSTADDCELCDATGWIPPPEETRA